VLTLLLVIYIFGAGVVASLDMLATALHKGDMDIIRSFIIVALWPLFLLTLLGARLIYKLKNPYSEDEE